MKGWLDKIKIGKNSIEGYRNDSPDRFNDINIINSPNISMQNVDYPITAYPSSGKPTVMYPGAEYYFPGAEYVTEVPHKQLGGDIEQKWLTTRQNGGAIRMKEGVTSGREVPTRQVVPLPAFRPYTEAEMRNIEHAQDIVRQAPQPKSKIAKAFDIARNPMTAIQSMNDRGSVPDNFDKGDRNVYDNALDFINPMTYADAIGRTLSAKHFRDMTDEKGKIDWNKLPDALVKTGLDAGMVTGLASEAKLTPQKYYIENANPYLMDASTMKGPDILDMGIDGTFRTPKRAWDIEIEDPEFTKASEKANQVSQNNAKAKERFVLDKNDYYKREITDQDIVIPAAGNYKNITNPTNPLSFSGIALNDLNQPIPVQDSTNDGYANIQTQQLQDSVAQPKPILKADTPKKFKKIIPQAKIDTPIVQQQPMTKKEYDSIIYERGKAGSSDSYHNISQDEYEQIPRRKNGGTIQKFQIGGTSKDNQDSKVAQRVKMDDWLTKYPSDQVVRPAPQGMSPELANAHMNKYAQQQGFQTYGDMQNAQAMRDNPNWEKAGEFANKVADIYGAVEGAGYLGRGALRKLAEKHWGEPAGAAERYTVAPRDADSYITWGKKNPNVSVQNIDGPESSKISDMSLVEGPNPRDMTKEQKILKSFGLDPYQKGTAVEANRANIIKGNNPNNLPDILSSTIEPHKFGGKVKNNWLQKYK